MTLSLVAALCLAGKPVPVSTVPVRASVDALATAARALKTEQLVSETRRLNDELEFEKLVPYARELSSRAAAPLEARRDAWLLLASALVILGDPVSAERPFTQLLRVEPQFELPTWVEPKVALVFKKVQAEERELARALKQRQREAKVAAITLRSTAPEGAVGGKPLPFVVNVNDPASDVRAVRVAWRRPGESAFSSLALTQDERGEWRGEVPAELTQSEQGLLLDYYVESSDAEGPLATLASTAAPRTLAVKAGKLETPWRAPLPRWVFFGTAGLMVAGGAVTGVAVGSAVEQQRRFTLYANGPGPLSYQLEQQLRADGLLATERANISVGIFVGLAVATLVVGLLTDWRD